MHELSAGLGKVVILLVEFRAQAPSRAAVQRHLIGVRHEQPDKRLQASPGGTVLLLERRQPLTAFLGVGVDCRGDEFVK